ncbi:MAG: thiamine pyrophosphate-dependent dehydrogenase E1 component subunit alpha [Planctomycetes bacterium]|nr:thiamine pyrophosphate-dependent dehydrogenase E1 component subunit alpha [Planctomycetota bacterium]
MLLARLVDERLATLYSQNRIPGGSVFLGKGQEALSAALGMYLRPPRERASGDIYGPLIRDLAGRLAFGETLLTVMRTNLMRRTGPMRGRDGNIHRGEIERGILPMISHLGSLVSVVCGTLLARRLRGDLGHAVGATCIGDGGMQTGALHEGLNVAAVEKLPLVVVVADNQLSYSTFSDRTYACRSLADRAVGYGFTGYEIDGTNADACLATLSEAVRRARAGEGPQMVVASLLRGAGHGAHDDAKYVGTELKSRFGDCLTLYEQTLVRSSVIASADAVAWRNEATEAINGAVAQASGEPQPDPAQEDWNALSSKRLHLDLMPRRAAAGGGAHQ